MQSDFFSNNRQRLLESLDGGVVVLSAYKSLQWKGDTAIPFRQEANFWYMTGIEEPDWWVIIEGSKAKTWLVAPPDNEHRALFDGGLSQHEAKEISGATEVISHDRSVDLLRQLARQHQLAYTIQTPEYYGQMGFTLNPAQRELSDVLKRVFTSVQNCTKTLASLRAIKQECELAAIKKAVRITTSAYQKLYDILPTLRYEYEVEAVLSYEFRMNGAAGHSYDPIVASGKNACTLHYMHNSAPLKKNSYVLIDVAARYGQYGADITRTYAVGAPPLTQQKIHEALQQVQREIIGLLEPGLALTDLQERSDNMMKKVLYDLQLTSTLSDEKWRDYFPHAIGHGLGIDVHDSFGGYDTLQPGMVLTIEPGIYMSKRMIGMRIEDTVYIGQKKATNLSRQLSIEA